MVGELEMSVSAAVVVGRAKMSVEELQNQLATTVVQDQTFMNRSGALESSAEASATPWLGPQPLTLSWLQSPIIKVQ